MKDVDDMILVVRAQERQISKMNILNASLVFVIDAVALVCNKKPLKIFAFIWTIMSIGDHIRMYIASENARKGAIEEIEDEDIKDMAKEFTTFSGVLNIIKRNGLKYQLTGKIKDIKM